MSSKRAKELKALATSLALVEDDLLQKRYFRKSQYYQETEQFKREKKAKELAAFNLLKDKQITPLISGVLSNAIVNAPPVVFGADEEKEEIIRTPVVSGTSNELRKATAQLRRATSVPTTKRDEDLLEKIRKTREKLKPLPPMDFIPPEKRRPQTSSESEAEELRKGIFEKSPVRNQEKIDMIMGELIRNIKKKDNFIPSTLIKKMTINQLQSVIKELLEREPEIMKDEELTDKNIFAYRYKIGELRDRLEQKQNPRRRGRPKKVKDTTEASTGVARKSKTDKFFQKMMRERQKSLKTSTIPLTGSEGDVSEMAGEGMKQKFMKYYGSGKIKMTADMKKLLMLMGSINAGNDNPKLRVEYERLRKKIMKSVHSKMK